CTTDDPADDLRHHEAIAKGGLETRVLPAFRPDAALMVNKPESFTKWLGRLEDATGASIGSLSALLEALRQRSDFFHERGCRLSGSARHGELPAPDDPVQPQSRGQLPVGHNAREFSGRHDSRQDSARERLVVSRSKRGDGMAAQRRFQSWTALAVRRHGYR